MTDLTKITSNLEQREDGVWVARQLSEISYPEEGNETCFAVEDDSYWFRHRNNVITHLVGKYSPSATFFDIGGGNGCVANALQTAGIDTVLVEPGSLGTLNAKQRGVRTVVQSTLEDAGFAQQSIPSAGLFDVIEHIEHDANFLRQINDYMQPDGVLYVTVPAFSFLWSNDDVRAGHFRRYTAKSLSRVLTESGFSVAYCGGLFSFLVPPIMLFRSIPSWMGFRKSVSQATSKKEHAAGSGLVNRVVQGLLRSELAKIKKGQPVRIGSSCIAVARKTAGGS